MQFVGHQTLLWKQFLPRCIVSMQVGGALPAAVVVYAGAATDLCTVSDVTGSIDHKPQATAAHRAWVELLQGGHQRIARHIIQVVRHLPGVRPVADLQQDIAGRFSIGATSQDCEHTVQSAMCRITCDRASMRANVPPPGNFRATHLRFTPRFLLFRLQC